MTFAVKLFEEVDPFIFPSADTQKKPPRPAPCPIVALSEFGPTAQVSLPEEVEPLAVTTTVHAAKLLASST